MLINPLGFNRKFIPSIGIVSIGTILKNAGYDVSIVDSNFMKNNPNSEIEKFKPDIVGISCLSSNYSLAMKIAKFAKEKGIIVVIGGQHISLVQEEILQNNRFVDFGIVGDGEYSFLELVKRIEKGSKVYNIPGLIFRKNRKIIKNKPKLIKNLDSLPFPDYSLLNIKNLKFYPLSTSRGCPFNCIYCCIPIISERIWRARSPQNVIEEIKIAKKKYKPKYFLLIDDNFSFDIKRAKEICKLLIQKRVDIKWYCSAGIRADRFDEELGTLMKKSGCTTMVFGIESGDPEVFNRLNKGESLKDIETAIKICKKLKFSIEGFFIIGLPGSDKTSEEKSFEFAKKLNINSNWFFAIPFPKTKLYELTKGNIIKNPVDNPIGSSWNATPFLETDKFSRHEMKKIYILNNLKAGNYYISRENGIADLLISILRYDAINLPKHLLLISKRIITDIWNFHL